MPVTRQGMTPEAIEQLVAQRVADATVGHDAAYGMPWKKLMEMMTKNYCPRSEIKSPEIELWNLKVKGTDVVSYTQRFQELALLCARMFPEESDQVEKYTRGLPNSIKGNVMSARPKTLQEATELAKDLIGQKVRTYAERHADNKRSFDNNLRDNQVQQPPFKRQNMTKAYTAGSGEKRAYAGTLTLCNKCKYHHTGSCTSKCRHCKRIGHQTKDCMSLAVVTNQRALVANQKTLTCFECGNQGHYMSDCPESKNQNHGNQPGNGEVCGRVYALGGGETDQDLNNIEDDIDA
ncbi:reverse transcriptase domain-containing protein [Tanacetum coccineum]